MKPKILIVEDEPQLVGILEYLLKTEEFTTVVAYNGEDALKIINDEKLSLVILDIMLPKMDGFEVCNSIRKYTTIPVIILSAKNEEESIIKGLELGADDYITKPFNHRELILRVKKLLERSVNYKENRIIKINDIQMDIVNRVVSVNNENVELTPVEFNLLLCLAKNEGRVLSWESLLTEVWGHDNWEGGNELIKVNIRRLRKKIEPDPAKPVYILNIWGVGYKLVCPA